MSIEIRQHVPGQDIDDFIRAASVVFKNDPAWIQPLAMDIRDRLTPSKNPFFLHGEVALFTAWKNGQLVGRCSAQLDHEHLRIYNDKTGFFGFFDTIDDDEVGARLLDAAREWLKARGMTRMRGPLSLNMNEEVGLLIDGHEHPPVLLMGHSRDYQSRIATAAGLEKAKDLYAWRFVTGKLPKRAEKAWARINELPEVTIRSVNTWKMDEELAIIMEIFNDAWKDNWGFVPATPEELKKTADDMRLILDKNLSFIAEVNGRPMGMCVCLPNVNEVIRDFKGKLGPVEVAKLLWRLKVRNPVSGRLLLLGIHSDLRGVKKYGGLSHALYVEIAKRGAARGYQWGELGWTLEDNKPINLGIRSMGAKIYKTYRVYEQSLDGV